MESPDGTAGRTFERLGRSPGEFAAALDDQEADDLRGAGVEAPDDYIRAQPPSHGVAAGVYPSEPLVRELFQSAGEDARRHGGSLTGAHVLRAAADLEHGVVARTLRRMGLDPEALRTVSTEEIENQPTS